jgi:hypothetical protein
MSRVSNRQKGIQFVREAKKIVETEWGHKTDGPFYKSTYFGGQIRPVHTDLFGVFDFISFDKDRGVYLLHQVTVADKKASKAKAITQAGLVGYVWCRSKTGNRVHWRVWWVEKNHEIEMPVEGP